MESVGSGSKEPNPHLYRDADIEVSATLNGKSLNTEELKKLGIDVRSLLEQSIQSNEISLQDLLEGKAVLEITYNQKKSSIESTTANIFKKSFLGESDTITLNFHRSRFSLNAPNYGNKASNLIRLEEILSSFSSEDVSIGVPPICPLSHQEILDFLDIAFYEWKDQWESFLKELETAPEGASSSSDRPAMLSNKAREILTQLGNNIRQAFTENPFFSENLHKFLQENNSPLMVRSTGKEDTEALANAGGNESIAAVEPLEDAISSAIGRVVASYFSVKSIEQRLLEGDDVSSVEPFMPVLIQRMVGEGTVQVDSSEDIPSAGVAFSRLLGVGGLGKGPDQVENPSNWQVVINAARGHGEGVVTSKVSTDTYYVGENGSLHSVIRRKPTRVSTTDSPTKLELVKNPENIESMPAIPKEMVHLLGKISREIETAYKVPVDIEWVYEPREKKLYIVQARPIVQKRDSNPSTVNLENCIDCSRLKLSTIGAAGGSLRLITEPSKEIIIAKTLEKALDHFLHMPDRNQLKAIIVEDMAAPTSHEATTFRGQNIPVLRLADRSAVDEWIESGKPFVIDAQRELAIELSHKEITSFEDLEEKGLVKHGWAKHPISTRLSLQAIEEITENEIRELLETLGVDRSSTLTNLYPDKHIKTLVDELTELSDTNEIKKVLLTVLQRLAIRKSMLIKEGSHLIEELNRVLWQSVVIMREILHAAEKLEAVAEDQYKSSRLEFLYSCNWLEATLFQQSDPEVIGDTSYIEVLREQKFLRSTSEYYEKPVNQEALDDILSSTHEESSLSDTEKRAFFVQYMKLQKFALNEDIAEKWQNFVHLIAKSGSPYHNHQLSLMLKNLQKAGVLATWINTVFHESSEEWMKAPSACFDQLLTKTGEMIEVTSSLSRGYDILDKWENRISQWGDPGQFDALWEEFQQEFNSEILNPGLFDRLRESSSSLEKIVLIEFLTKATDLYDQTVKSLKGSPEYTDKTLLVQRFSTMLEPFLNFMERSIRLIPGTTLRNMHNWINYQKTGSVINIILGAIKNRFFHLKKNSEESMLNPSAAFSVASSTISSGALPERSIENARSLEDLFTLFHQNILVSLANVNPAKESLLKCVPTHLQVLLDELGPEPRNRDRLSLESGPIKHLTTVDYNYPLLTLNYNIPLKNHSGNLTLIYNRNTNRCKIIFNLFGENFHDRMTLIVEQAKLLSFIFPNTIEPSYDDMTRVFSCSYPLDLNNPSIQSMAQLLEKEFTAMASATFQVSSGSTAEKLNTLLHSADKLGLLETNPRLQNFAEVFEEFSKNPHNYNSLCEALYFLEEFNTHVSMQKVTSSIATSMILHSLNSELVSKDLAGILNLLNHLPKNAKKIFFNHLYRSNYKELLSLIKKTTPLSKNTDSNYFQESTNALIELLTSEEFLTYSPHDKEAFFNLLKEKILSFVSFTKEACEKVDEVIEYAKNRLEKAYDHQVQKLIKELRTLSIQRVFTDYRHDAEASIFQQANNFTKNQKKEFFSYLKAHPDRVSTLISDELTPTEEDIKNPTELLVCEEIQDYPEIIESFFILLQNQILSLYDFSKECCQEVERLIDEIKTCIQKANISEKATFIERLNHLNIERIFRHLSVLDVFNQNLRSLLYNCHALLNMTERQKVEFFTYLGNFPEEKEKIFNCKPYNIFVAEGEYIKELQKTLYQLQISAQKLDNTNAMHIVQELQNQAEFSDQENIEKAILDKKAQNIPLYLEIFSSHLKTDRRTIFPHRLSTLQPDFTKDPDILTSGTLETISEKYTNLDFDKRDQKIPFSSAKEFLKNLQEIPGFEQSSEKSFSNLFEIFVQLFDIRSAAALFNDFTENLDMERIEEVCLMIQNFPIQFDPLNFILARELIHRIPQDLAKQATPSLQKLRNTLVTRKTSRISLAMTNRSQTTEFYDSLLGKIDDALREKGIEPPPS